MRKIFNLALANIRKGRSQSISFFLITFISALLLNLGIITWLDYSDSFDKKAELLNAPDVTLVAQNNKSSFVTSFEQYLLGDKRVGEIETHSILLTGCEFHYADGMNSRIAAFFDDSQSSKMGKFSIIQKAEGQVENPIYLPYLFCVGGGYQIGDSFKISLFTATSGKREYTYKVAGFYEDIFFSTINSTVTGFVLDHQEYIALKQAFEGGVDGTLFSVKTKHLHDNEGVASQFRIKLNELCPYGILTNSDHYAALKSARTITSSIAANIIVGFSLMLLIVSLVVVNFRIRNSLEEEIKNIGAMKAIGYTSCQLICAFLMQFVLLALASSLLGILCSYIALPSMTAMFASQTGILWKQHFSLFAMNITIVIVEVLVSMVAFISAVPIKKLHPIVALRTGILTHSFRCNPFPLERGRGLLVFTMAGKQLVHNVKQNILVALIIAGVTFAAIFAGVLYYNINIESDVFIRMVSGEIPHGQLDAADEKASNRLLDEVKSKEQVKKAFFFSNDMVLCEEDYEAYGYILNDFELVDNPDWIYAGRFPKYENEVAVNGLLAKLLHKEIGDTIRISKGNGKQEYLITGFIQGANYMGHDLCMTEDAFRRISKTFSPLTIYMYLYDRTKIDGFLDTLEDSSPNLLRAVNVDEVIRSSMSSYHSIVAILAVIISIVTLLMIVLVLYLVIKTLLIRKKQELGIQKAIGFTTGQLVLQNALAFLPVIVFGALVGCISGYFGVNPFFRLLFSSIGMIKVSFEIYVPLLVSIFGVIVLFGFIVSILVFSKIKQISPYMLMSE